MKATFELFRLCAAAALLAACSITDPAGGEQPGFIEALPEMPAQVTVPATAPRGEPFTVTVITQGGGCVRQGPTRFQIRGMTADVRPYDIHNGSNVCTADVQRYEHTATLRFDQAGTVTVNFHGAAYPGPQVTVTRTVTIQ